MKRAATQVKPKSVLLPWEFPDEFFEEMGILRDSQRYTAIFWQPFKGAVIYTGHSFRNASFQCSRQVVILFLILTGNKWLEENRVNLGLASLRVTHWLLFDKETGLGWAAPVKLASLCAEKQEILGWEEE